MGRPCDVFSGVIHVCDALNDDRRQYISITNNLYNALQRLRHDDLPRSLWIDALCINQTGLKEKGHQVAHTGQIYARADRVVVWLGDAGEHPKFKVYLQYKLTGKFIHGTPMNSNEIFDLSWYVRRTDPIFQAPGHARDYPF